MKLTLQPGALFPKSAHTVFLDVTRTRYGSMVERYKKKKLPPPPFTLEEFRFDMLKVMDGHEDGAIQCRYCRLWFALDEVAVDHATPLSRGGGLGLDNLDYPCRADNNRKGSLTVKEYEFLLAALERVHPLARQDVLSRLEKANQLAAGQRNLAGTIGELKKTGHWQQAQANRRAAKQAKNAPPF
jgi:5-methylcytosine-specific restriction endonuclease McrA